jgi:hypothetical protein
MKGFHVGFDTGYRDGRLYGRSEVRSQMRELLGVDESLEFRDVLPPGKTESHQITGETK